MKRVDDMAGRLPPLYREGELVASVLAQPALQLEILDEELIDVQRARHFDSALELDDAAKLAELLDFRPEPWQDLALFRSWVHAQRDAVLEQGGVTIAAILSFLESYAASYQDAVAVRFPRARPVLVENPPVRRLLRLPLVDNITPLSRFSLVNGGLDPTPVSFLLQGLPGGPESVPVIVNLTTGQGLIYLGNIAPGERLWLRAGPDGLAEGRLERQDVTDRLQTLSNVSPGEPWKRSQVQSPARAIRLERGQNDLWFLPVAHYDALGLDRFLLALADLGLAQGHWDDARFEHAVFAQDAAVSLSASWLETAPASFEVRMAAQAVRTRPSTVSNPEEARAQLGKALEMGIRRLAAAGVRSAVRLQTFAEVQPQSDHVTAVLPLRLREAGSTGADSIPDVGALFDVTGYGDSTFR